MNPTVTPDKEKTSTRPQRTRRSRVIGAIVAILAMAGLGWLAWHLTHQPAGAGAGAAAGARGQGGGPGAGGGGPGGGRGGRGGMAATTVGVGKAERSDIPITLEALGTVTPAAVATVRPQVGGVLQKITFTEGQLVKEGQVLATIDARPAQMSVLQATGQRQRDEAQLESARVLLQRYRTLLEQDSIARQDVDTQAALVKQLEGTVTTDKAAEGIARINLGYTQVRAPISGRVGLRTVDIGNLVNSGDTNGIAVITQMSPIDVEFAVPQDQLPELQQRIGQNAVLPAIALDRTRTQTLAEGRFFAMDNQVDTQTGTVRAKARFTNDGGKLFPSQFVNIRLQVNTIKNAITVPVTALRHGASGDYVYVLNPQTRTVALRNVKRGQANAERVEIASGLEGGETVITEGADRLKDGAKVTLPGDRPAGGAGGRRGQGGQGGAAQPAEGSAQPAPAGQQSQPGQPGQHRRRQQPAEGTAQ
ncbi:secretion protein HlyD [Massilia sp. WF1]|uniref:efflux RND transporter periplasmic adaptor subunit n=1 Tax=unclassified Massilia TaxID=2609279 RepID=UPI00064ABB30|nr:MULTISPECIES: efflux RND transporter periplasmic adaptor subunit [unclassified Massilia]ALK98075.1 efflux transporter periplasmic adaptor subunit [Massilia sp. WG5]KLU35548.1 secretion protein HlyD [Massilia sp. WF1]